jgi:hypothetical protein
MSFDAITVIGVVIALAVALYVVKTIISAVKGPEKKSGTGLETHVHKECASCGWSGTVSKYVKKCSNCGESLY